MTQIVIDIGATANDGTGDPLRTAFEYVNNNFTQIFTAGPVDSNIRIVDNRILTINTNGNLVLAPNGIGKVMANVDILPTYANALSLGSSNNRWNTVYTRNIDITGTADFAGNINITGPAIFNSNVVIDGNLTVNGTTTTINTSNVDIADKVITLAFGSPNAEVANNSGINIAGADANIKYFNISDQWAFNKSIFSTGNITTVNGNVVGHTILGNIKAAGGNGQIQYNRNGIISASPEDFNYDETDGTLYVVAGQFAGQPVTGSNALYAGLPEFTFLGSAIVLQMAGNVSGYTQVNFQNINSSNIASGDYIITADNGTDTTYFLDMGMTSSAWDGTQENSLGNLLTPNNGYLYVQDGDFTIGTKVGNATANVWTFDSTGHLTVPGNIIPDTSNAYSLGNSTNQWADLYVSNTTIYMNNVPISLGAGNVLTVNGEAVLSNDSDTNITTTGNVTATVLTATESADLGSLNFFASSITMADDVWDNIFIAPNGESYAYLQIPKDSVANVQNTRLHNDAGNVEIGTSGGTNLWLFDAAGDLNLPNNGDLKFNAGGIVQTPDEDLDIRVQDAEDDGWSLYNTVDDGAGTPLGRTRLQRDQFNINIQGQQWQFDNQGRFNLAGNIQGTYGGDTSFYAFDNGSGGMIEMRTISYIGDTLLANVTVRHPNVTISTQNSAYTWTFDGTGNLTAPGNITTTANISGGYILGNGSQLTGLPASYTDSNVTSLLSAYGSNTISTSGNITAGNISVTGNVVGNITFTGGNILIDNSTGAGGSDEGGELHFAAATANSTLSGPIAIDIYQNKMRFFETNGNTFGMFIDIANTMGVDGSPLGVPAIGYRDVPQISLSANVTANVTNAGKHFYSTTAGNVTLTIPDNANVAFPTGATLTIVMNAAGNVIVAQGTGVSLYMAGSSTTGNRVVGAYGLASVMKVATDTWVISGTGVY